MSFLVPLMLLGLLGVAAPVWLHLHGAKRARRVDFAAVDFLLGSDRKVARSLRLKEILLLIARIAVFAVVPLLLAKPLVSCQSHDVRAMRGPQGAVIVIDNGLAAGYRLDGETLLDRAKRRARALVEQLGPEADLAVLLTTDDDAPGDLSRDHLRLRDRIAEIAPSARGGDTRAALARAAHLLAGSANERKTIFLFTTHVATTFAGSEMPWPAGAGPELSVIDLSDGQMLPNAAVTDIDVSPDPEAGPRSIRVDAELHNFGAEPTGEREARLILDDQVVARARVSLGPGDVVRQRFTASLPEGVRTTRVAVAMDPDALPVDDTRHQVAHLRQNVRVLLVNGDPRSTRYDDELFYLRAALGRDSGSARISEITADQIDDTDLGAVDVVVLANVAALTPDRVSALVEFCKGGGGLLIAAGDQVDPDAYDQTMGPLLPRDLASVFDAGYGASGAELDVKALHLAKLDTDHPVLKIFGAEGRGLKDAMFTKVVLLGPTTHLDSRRVLARYQNGAAALVEGSIGSGRVLLFTSTLDRDWDDLPIQPGYLPLVDKSLRYLAKKQLRAGAGDVLVGVSAEVSVEPSDRRLEIQGPRGPAAVLEGDRLSGREHVAFRSTDDPGFYTVIAVSRSGQRQARPESAFAVDIDPALSDLKRASAADIPEGGSGTAGGAGTTEHRVELWHALGAALLGLLLLEGLLVLRN